MDREKPRLGTVQETLLIPLYARAVENRKEHALLRDPRAEEIVVSIDYDFTRFDDLPSLTGALLRTRLFDRWAADFLSEHPDGTVVEIGIGLNTRYERVDNGRARWFDLDLPDVIALRRDFFTDTPRRTMIAGSVTDEPWAAEVASQAAGPYLFLAEAVLPYLDETDVRRVVDLLADRFPGSLLGLDTAGAGFFDAQEHHDALSKVDARMHWYCPDVVAQLADWRPGVDVVASHTLTSLPPSLLTRLPVPCQQMVSAIAAQKPPQAEGYRLSLLRLP
ncbi:class I SAM-dependent methyltransferase [Streptomyces sp. DH41]|uniref:class I SAM-dependent methyltransferase n=1 Tax=Streptomyces sp. DH41 TaxID=3040125 RepID=UPI0024433953|nr:class I SAM-dependent methyltransferase [Streptomyces sp. DH41]MDG9726803.1 class I SAM-dependent methyltransferase [Streptomyces sp. DH41]